jgi:hypothetical protein
MVTSRYIFLKPIYNQELFQYEFFSEGQRGKGHKEPWKIFFLYGIYV